ncbi:MAG: hypothetical protein ACYTFW_10265 [Planctomycetota bacterium]|jgi:hypothetical protein
MSKDKEPVMDFARFNGLMDTIKMLIPENCSFFIFVAENGDPREHGGKCKYGSSIQRDSAVNIMKEFLIKNGTDEEWINNLDTE